MALDRDVLSDDIKLALETKMEDLIGQPYVDTKPDLDNMLEAISHAVGEATIDHIEPEVEDGSYTPGVPADWAAPNPTTVQEALDRLGTAVRGLLGSKIP